MLLSLRNVLQEIAPLTVQYRSACWQILSVSPDRGENLHPRHLIEQISYEQLLSASIARFHFITADKRSDSICALQLRAGPWCADSRSSIYGDGRNYLDISFYGSTNWPVRDASQGSINHRPQDF